MNKDLVEDKNVKRIEFFKHVRLLNSSMSYHTLVPNFTWDLHEEDTALSLMHSHVRRYKHASNVLTKIGRVAHANRFVTNCFNQLCKQRSIHVIARPKNDWSFLDESDREVPMEEAVAIYKHLRQAVDDRLTV